jgi:hypothetical protein
MSIQIDERTRIPLKLAVTAILVVVGGHLWLMAQLNEIKLRLTLIEKNTTRRFTLNDMKLWAAELKSKNPNLNVPAPESGEGRDINN